ncbi:MAG: FAD-dependent thymidylate synthase [Anaerolineales bacterium]|nr:FAD-dependent thymidylate synthase [Anaerolineales bacterium]
MSFERQIYLLSPRELSAETIAVAFAKTSRSPESFREIAAELTDEQSARFHEKWVVGYGHASVAEHAVLHIAIENVSRLAVECIESNRLASYTEKSTRYQKWDPEAFLLPPELDGHPLQERYVRVCRLLFETYQRSLEPVKRVIAAAMPRRENESEEAHDRRIRSRYVDVCRFLLPGAALANLGMTANARVLEGAIRKMLSHPLQEVRQIGAEVKHVALNEAPTLVKYADAQPYLMETATELEQVQAALVLPERENGDWCRLIAYDPEGELKVLAAALYRFGQMGYDQALMSVRTASEEQRRQLAHLILGRLGEHDVPLRELEHTSYTFDLLLDQGAYAEFKRHRMMTQTPQRPSTRLGYLLPRLMVEAGLETEYRTAMEAAAECYETLAAWNPHVAGYIVPNGFHRRVLFTMNLREAFAFCRLRAASNAHFSIRRVAQRVAAEIRRVHPLLGGFLRLPEEPWEWLESEYFVE